MQPDFISGSPLYEALWAVGILLISALVAWLVLLGMRFAERRLKRAKSKALPRFLESISRPIFVLIIAEGLVYALSSLSWLEKWRPYFLKASIALIIILVTWGLARGFGELLAWYMTSRRIRRKTAVDPGFVRFLRRVTTLVIYLLGVLILLDYFDIAITPIIASLGIGGLAVALALQPTLANFFAGTQIVSDRVVRVGDYIELDNGTRGYVTDVGWRSTRIRTPYNNQVIIPNSRLAESIITNYYGPSMELAVIVNAGVSYSSDLTQVRSVALDVAHEVIDELDEAVKTFEPWFGYEEFGESNINFWIWMQAKDRVSSFHLKSEIIRRLHARFRKEGITINYPVRHLTYDRPDDMPNLLRPSNPDTDNSE